MPEPDGITLETFHADPEYLEEVLGQALHSHLRGMDRIADFRRAAVHRAFSMYKDALKGDKDELDTGGLGLLVNQRTLLAVEDLGALLYALSGPASDRWARFTSYGPADLDSFFEGVVFNSPTVRQLFSFPSDDEIADEPDLTDLQRQALTRLRDITEVKIKSELDFVAGYWLARRVPTKALSHGWIIVAAPHLLDSPGAGVLSDQVAADTPRPFTLALFSTEHREAEEIRTETHVVDLRHEDVELVSRTADTACDLMEALAEARIAAAKSRAGLRFQSSYRDHLSSGEQAALEELKSAGD